MRERDVEDVSAEAHRAPDESSAECLGEIPPSTRVIDALERVLPDLPSLGAILLVLFLILAGTGEFFGASDDLSAVLQDADEATAQAIGYVPL